MSVTSIPVFEPTIGADTLEAIRKALEIGWLGMGATTLEFEQAIQQTLATNRPVIATMTGTAALHLGLQLAGVSPGDEVILPSFNFIADVQAVLWCGATPVFCDIQAKSLCLDPDRVLDLIGPRTKAIMPLHFAGHTGAIHRIHEIAATNGIRVVEDATHAFGSVHRGRKVGAFGDIVCFSFDPVKVITSVDGGAVVCRPDENISRLHQMRLLGIDKDTTERYRNSRAWDYDVTLVGHRSHMTNINAAIGLSQLCRLQEFIDRRRAICRTYSQAFAGLDWLSTPATDFTDMSPFIYTIRVNGQRVEFIQHMRERNVSTGIHFIPLHTKSLCQRFPSGPLDVTNRVGHEIVTLPLWSHMPQERVDSVIDAVMSFQQSSVTV